jgi:hypothetical protein
MDTNRRAGTTDYSDNTDRRMGLVQRTVRSPATCWRFESAVNVRALQNLIGAIRVIRDRLVPLKLGFIVSIHRCLCRECHLQVSETKWPVQPNILPRGVALRGNPGAGVGVGVDVCVCLAFCLSDRVAVTVVFAVGVDPGGPVVWSTVWGLAQTPCRSGS